VWALSTAQASDSSSLAKQCSDRAQLFLTALDDDQLAKANWPFTGKQRRKWTYFPNVPELDIRTEGLAIKDMSSDQRVHAHALIECGLSSQGYQKAAGIMRLDDILAQTDLFRPKNPEDEAPVDSEKYWLAIFGNPAGTQPWGWQLEGHHLALNFTVAGDGIVFAPAFMGADPARVPDGRYAGWRLMGEEIDQALTLVNALSAEQRGQAILAGEIPERLFTSPGREDALQEFAGLATSDMNDQQLVQLRRLLDVYVHNAAEPIAEKHLLEIEADFAESTWFAWMGPTESQAGIYYRIHSPSVLIEFVTARNRQSKAREPNPNHVHSIFVYPGNNYGDDLLAQHYATSSDHEGSHEE
jgi:hypothetical protein